MSFLRRVPGLTLRIKCFEELIDPLLLHVRMKDENMAHMLVMGRSLTEALVPVEPAGALDISVDSIHTTSLLQSPF